MNIFGGFGRDMTEIAALIITLAAIGLLVTNAQGTATAAQGVSSAFSGVLATATFQKSGVGNAFNNF